jgi:hypothetical protein
LKFNINSDTGLKLLQTLLNVPRQLHAKTNATIVLSTAPNIVALLINLFHLRSNLFTSIIFLFLKFLFFLEIQLLQMILLLYLHQHLRQFISMVSNMVIFLKLWLNSSRIYLPFLNINVILTCLL